MEKVDWRVKAGLRIVEKEPNKIEEFRRVNELYNTCLMWILKHGKQRPRSELSDSERELHDIADTLHLLMTGKKPFEILRRSQYLDIPIDWIHRMGAYLLTKNKKKVSDLFCLQDDGKSLTQYLASRASDFLYEEEYEGLTASQALNKLVELLEQYPETKEHYTGLFEDHFDAWVEDKQAVDVSFKSYSFEEWIKIATKK